MIHKKCDTANFALVFAFKQIMTIKETNLTSLSIFIFETLPFIVREMTVLQLVSDTMEYKTVPN